MARILIFILAFNLAFLSCASDKKDVVQSTEPIAFVDEKLLPDGLYAIVQTDKGEIALQLFYDKAPLTVMNFVGLASGKINGKMFYDGLSFHRVEKDFVLQGGDPNGNGSGGAGYTFSDEIVAGLKHTQGAISMANAGPNTNSSQFFIVLDDSPELDGTYSVFGKVYDKDSMTVVNAIKKGDLMKHIKVVTKGDVATSFFKSVSKENFFKLAGQKKEEAKAMMQKELAQYGNVMTSPEGILYAIKREGSGEKPKKGQEVECHYTLKLLNGTVVDSSLDRGETFKFKVGAGQVIKGWDLVLQDMKRGEQRVIIVPPELGYGKMGVEGVIPPDSYLEFDIELVDYK